MYFSISNFGEEPIDLKVTSINLIGACTPKNAIGEDEPFNQRINLGEVTLKEDNIEHSFVSDTLVLTIPFQKTLSFYYNISPPKQKTCNSQIVISYISPSTGELEKLRQRIIIKED